MILKHCANLRAVLFYWRFPGAVFIPHENVHAGLPQIKDLDGWKVEARSSRGLLYLV
jgi:hypothetical protein